MKLLNFSIDQQVYLQSAGQTFDLHNAFTLRGYSYDTGKRAFTLNLQGKIYWSGTPLTTDLNIVFEQVCFLRIQEPGKGAEGSMLAAIRMVDEMVDESRPYNPSNLAIQIEELFRTDEIEERDWHNHMIIEFHFGASMLVSAETVSAFFTQRNTE